VCVVVAICLNLWDLGIKVMLPSQDLFLEKLPSRPRGPAVAACPNATLRPVLGASPRPPCSSKDVRMTTTRPSVSSNQLHISRARPNRPPLDRTPPHNPHIPPLHLKPPIRALNKYIPYVPQHPHEHRLVLVRLVHHADPTRRIVQSLQRSRELPEERRRVVCCEERLVGCEVLVFGGREEGL
jgi:hypothetical protein